MMHVAVSTLTRLYLGNSGSSGHATHYQTMR